MAWQRRQDVPSHLQGLAKPSWTTQLVSTWLLAMLSYGLSWLPGSQKSVQQSLHGAGRYIVPHGKPHQCGCLWVGGLQVVSS